MDSEPQGRPSQALAWGAVLVVAALALAALAACGGGSAGAPLPPPEPPLPSWTLWKTESFDGDAALADGEAFGADGWLTATLRGGGAITLEGGLAHVETPDFADSALLRITESLPENYRIRVRLGGVDYALSNYEPEDSEDPDFKYTGAWKENGFYWLTMTDRLVEAGSGEDWWHRYRKVVIDSDDHRNTPLPVYMVYMNPDLDRAQGDWTDGASDLLRSWKEGAWRIDSWSIAFRYDPLAFYEVEIERLDGVLVMRTFDADGSMIEETSPVDVDKIYGMGKQASEYEFAYVGEPHIDSYEGEAFIDSITMWVWSAGP